MLHGLLGLGRITRSTSSDLESKRWTPRAPSRQRRNASLTSHCSPADAAQRQRWRRTSANPPPGLCTTRPRRWMRRSPRLANQAGRLLWFAAQRRDRGLLWAERGIVLAAPRNHVLGLRNDRSDAAVPHLSPAEPGRPESRTSTLWPALAAAIGFAGGWRDLLGCVGGHSSRRSPLAAGNRAQLNSPARV
jgi:hypothetical protein